MPSVLAIVSKAIFERDAKIAGRVAGLGDVVPLDRYVSKNKGLAPVGEGGALFLVTVRPPDEVLWLVAILEAPKFDGENWVAVRNVTPIADIGSIRDRIRFANDSGISAKKGALGMSLQTPRVLSDADVVLLRAGGGAVAAPPAEKGHLNAHEPQTPTPCLCKKCLPNAPERFTTGDLTLVRDCARAKGRFLWYWLPESIAGERAALRTAVASRIRARVQTATEKRQYDDLDEVLAQGDDDE